MVVLENSSRARVFTCTLSFAVLLVSSITVLTATYRWDRAVTQALNSLTRRSFLFDAGCHAIAENTMFSGMIFIALLWYCWFSWRDLPSRYNNLTGTVAAAIAGLLSRATQLMFPDRARPFQDAALQLKLPFTIQEDSLRHVASSFPSDHAALYFALAATIFSVNRKLGYYALALAVLLNGARLYLGFHYLSDIIGGAALGVFCVSVIQNLKIASIVKRVQAICEAPSPAFYAVAFCITYGVATMFSDVRLLASHLSHHVRH